MKIETRAIHVPKRRTDGAIAAPLQLSTTYEHGPANDALFPNAYIRDGNPNVNDLQGRLTSLEAAAGSVVFASGMAAGVAVLQTLKPGAHVLFHKNLYFDFMALANKLMPQWSVTFEQADFTDKQAFEKAMGKRPSLVWFETPSNPQLEVIDIQAVSDAAHAVGAKVLLDSTFAPPTIQQSIEHGVDFVLHSLTKFMGGHSDIQGGSISFARDEGLFDELAHIRRVTGGVLSPFNAWMVSRGLQTLACRMDRHCENALAVAQAMESHPKVSRVRYPFLENDPGYEIAQKQMTAGGGVVSIEIKGGREAALDVASKVKLFTNATSLGGVESLIEHRASVEGDATSTPEALLRLSIGLEAATDLIDDLSAALK